MENLPAQNKLQESIKKIRFAFYNIRKQAWPIEWKNFQESDVIIKAVTSSTNGAKMAVAGSILGIVLSFTLLFYGFYIVGTKEAPDQGGEIREAIIDSQMSIFNPVTSFESDAEQRVNSLLYLPLYSVTYPDYLSTETTKPLITPKLLAKNPEWQNNDEKPAENYKKLKFVLKKDLKWSNGKPLTLNDVQYTFELLKPTDSNPGGNSQFKEAFRQVSFTATGDYDFELSTPTASPQLIYNSNFSPISKEYFSGLNIERLNNDNRSTKPLVTSGYFTFKDGTIIDPDSTKNQTIENPTRDSTNTYFKSVILNRNPYQNTSQQVYVDKYIFKTYYNLEDTGSNSSSSLERAAKEGKIDILTRPISSNSNISSEKMKSKLGLNQVLTPSNTFYSLYLNIKKDQYFINQSLRKYVICEFAKFTLDPQNKNNVDTIPNNRKLIPIQLSQSGPTDCPDDTNSILDTRFYTISNDGGKKTINLYNEPITISLAGVEESQPILGQLKNYFDLIGIGVSDLIKDNTKLEESIKTKSYNATFLPITYTSSDPYSLYGSGSQNLIVQNQNNKVQSYDVENNLKKYASSNLSDSDTKNKLVEFFNKEYVSINLFRGKYEVNYSERIKKIYPEFTKNIPLVITLPGDVSLDFSQISFKTKRVGK
jgi:ABC-type transport system substrate-binding protein